MQSLMREDRFDFISKNDKAFILSFDEAIQRASRAAFVGSEKRIP